MKKEEQKANVPATTGAGAVGSVIDYGQDAGAGYEGQTKDDLSVPFINVLQSNSPEVTEREGAKPGMLYNTVTEEFGKDVVFVPACTDHVFVEWTPRVKGGGFVGVHKLDSPVVKAAKAASTKYGKYSTPAGNDLVETFYVYAVTLDAEDQPTGMAVLGFTSTKIGEYKRWNTKISMFMVPGPNGTKQRPPMFAHRVHLSTFKDRNEKGEFFNITLRPAKGDLAQSLLPPGHPAIESARELRKLVNEGFAKAAYSTAAQDEAPASPSGKGGDNNPDWA